MSAQDHMAALATIEDAKRNLLEFGELLEAVRTLDSIIPLGDLVYRVRDAELLGWEGPRVAAWSNAASMVRLILSRHPRAESRPSEGGE